MSKAQKETYLEQVHSGNIKTNAARVLQYIINHPDSEFMQIAKDVNMRVSSCTGRIAELHDAGLIYISKEEKVKGVKHSFYTFVSVLSEQREVRKARLGEKINKWINFGEKIGLIFNEGDKESFLNKILNQ